MIRLLKIGIVNDSRKKRTRNQQREHESVPRQNHKTFTLILGTNWETLWPSINVRRKFQALHWKPLCGMLNRRKSGSSTNVIIFIHHKWSCDKYMKLTRD